MKKKKSCSLEHCKNWPEVEKLPAGTCRYCQFYDWPDEEQEPCTIEDDPDA